MLSQILVAASAAIVFVLGTVHLLYTFATNKFSPRDAQLEQSLKQVSPVISRQTTMWKAWVGFNGSHSLGAMLFGAVYGYFAVLHIGFLQQSIFLMILGALFLMSIVVLAKLYWFNIPFIGITTSLALYLAGCAFAVL